MPSWCCPLRVHASSSSSSEPETEGFGQKVEQDSVHNDATMFNKDSVEGKMQSPIDLPLSNQDGGVAGLEAGDAYVETRPAAAAISAQGINFHVDWKEHGTGGTRLTLGDTVYEAVQFHFHTPSEHTIGGEPTAMELHFVHRSQDGGMAVVAVLFNEGEADPFLDQFWDRLSQVDVESTSADSIDIGPVDPMSLRLLRGPYYRYKGSLTTPPYTEGVEWIVMQKPLEVSKHQVSAFSQTLHQSNARQVQTLHSRHVSVRQNLPEQSPIDLFYLLDECNPVQQDGDVELVSGPGEAKIEPNGPNFRVTWAQDSEQKDGGANRLVVRGKVYEAVQFHFHMPSEHVVAGQAKAMELHLVHAAKDGSLAVVGIFFREGESNAFLEQFWDHLEKLNKSDESVLVGCIDPSALEISGPYYRYRGSLTTPPYSEGVEWTVFSEEAEVSLEQLETFRHTITTPNARAVQPLHHRFVSCCQ